MKLNTFHKLEEEFDMQGHNLQSSTISWYPFVSMEECDKDTNVCSKATGLLMDIMELLGKYYNFTIESINNPDGNWGAIVLDGDLPNKTFPGLFGKIVRREFDLSISNWNHKLEWDPLLDGTVSIFDNYLIQIINIKKPPMDLTLFFRPFKNESWLAILGLFFLLYLPLAIQSLCYRKVSIVNRKISLISGLCFLLIHSYYSGALTMFFSSPPRLPFSNIYEALELYPKWKLASKYDTLIIQS